MYIRKVNMWLRACISEENLDMRKNIVLTRKYPALHDLWRRSIMRTCANVVKAII